MGNISDFVMKENDIYVDTLREKFRDYLKGHFFHLSKMTGSLNVYKLDFFSYLHFEGNPLLYLVSMSSSSDVTGLKSNFMPPFTNHFTGKLGT